MELETAKGIVSEYALCNGIITDINVILHQDVKHKEYIYTIKHHD